jgi:hypothetical protein
MILFAAMSQEAWMSLETIFSSQSSAHSMAIRRQLADVKKLNMMEQVYYNKIKALADILASIG